MNVCAGLDTVGQYENQVLGTLPPHLFAVGKKTRNICLTSMIPAGLGKEDAMSRLKASLNLECQDYDWTGTELLIQYCITITPLYQHYNYHH